MWPKNLKKCKLVHSFSPSKVQCKITRESQMWAYASFWGHRELCLLVPKGCLKAFRNKMSCIPSLSCPTSFCWCSERSYGIYCNACVRRIPLWRILKYILICVAKPGIPWVESLFVKKYRNFLLSEWWDHLKETLTCCSLEWFNHSNGCWSFLVSHCTRITSLCLTLPQL